MSRRGGWPGRRGLQCVRGVDAGSHQKACHRCSSITRASLLARSSLGEAPSGQPPALCARGRGWGTGFNEGWAPQPPWGDPHWLHSLLRQPWPLQASFAFPGLGPWAQARRTQAFMTFCALCQQPATSLAPVPAALHPEHPSCWPRELCWQLAEEFRGASPFAAQNADGCEDLCRVVVESPGIPTRVK